jgi:N-acetylglucosamine kinase-like BadF-type ATPase
MVMDYILGIDQGGTKTAAVVMNALGEILGTGFGGAGNYAYTGMSQAMASVREAADCALDQAGLSLADVVSLSAGLSGADWPEEYDLLRGSLFEATGIGDIRVYNDSIIAMRGGTDKPYGAVICMGTGLNVAIRNPDGETFIYGYYIDGDHQGAGAIGHLALKAVIAADNGILGPTALTGMVLREYQARTVEELVRLYAGGQLSGRLKLLAPHVLEIAAGGDAVADHLVRQFGVGVAQYVTAGLRRYSMLDLDVDVVCSGSVLKTKHRTLRDVIRTTIQAECHQARLVDALYEPVVGAALLALDERIKPDQRESIRERVHASCQAMNLIRIPDAHAHPDEEVTR